MTKPFPKLDMPISEVLKLFVDGELSIVHNATTFEPYFLIGDKLYFGDDNDFWDYLSLTNRMTITYKALKANETLGSN
jgi:hypothetical protein